jgi:hypothetical protein
MADTKPADTSPAPVVEAVGGKDTTVTEDERKFTTSELTHILQERLSKQEAKFKKELAAVKKETTPEEKSKTEEWKAKLSEFEAQLKDRDEKIIKFRNTTLQKTVSSALAQAECVDPDLVAKDLISSGRILIDEDSGEVIAESITGTVSVTDVVVDYAKKKPYLFKSQSKGGVGTKSPSGIGSPDRLAELKAALGVASNPKNKLFG